jgi:hypothetical protein
MELVIVLGLVLVLNGIARRFGVDSRDGCDWCSSGS